MQTIWTQSALGPRVSVDSLVEPLLPRFETRAYTTIALSAAAVNGEIDYQRTALPSMIKIAVWNCDCGVVRLVVDLGKSCYNI